MSGTIVFYSFWLSPNGSISQDLIENYNSFSKRIRQSSLSDQFELQIWTDITTLDPAIKSKLDPNIIIKDYKLDVNYDSESLAYLAKLMEIIASYGDENFKLFYAIISDIFRIILLKSMSENSKYKNDIAIYLDGNDIIIKTIPSFAHLKTSLKEIGLAFSMSGIVNNDVIIADLSQKDKIDNLYQMLFNYLQRLEYISNDLSQKLGQVKTLLNENKGIAIRVAVAFSIAHPVNYFWIDVNDEKQTIYQRNWSKSGFELQTIQLGRAQNFLDFSSSSAKGLTWVGEYDNSPLGNEFWDKEYSKHLIMKMLLLFYLNNQDTKKPSELLLKNIKKADDEDLYNALRFISDTYKENANPYMTKSVYELLISYLCSETNKIENLSYFVNQNNQSMIEALYILVPIETDLKGSVRFLFDQLEKNNDQLTNIAKAIAFILNNNETLISIYFRFVNESPPLQSAMEAAEQIVKIFGNVKFKTLPHVFYPIFEIYNVNDGLTALRDIWIDQFHKNHCKAYNLYLRYNSIICELFKDAVVDAQSLKQAEIISYLILTLNESAKSKDEMMVRRSQHLLNSVEDLILKYNVLDIYSSLSELQAISKIELIENLEAVMNKNIEEDDITFNKNNTM